jgi:hypothetical protein
MWAIWLIFVVEMLFRLIPNKSIAMGARKHFSSSFKPANPVGEVKEGANLHKGVFLSVAGWFVITAAILIGLHFMGRLSPATVLILALVYSVFDVVFILFFCPFQRFFMRNFCCNSCRIHNWDYFFMFAPLLLFPSVFSVSLALISVAVIIRWEVALKKNPHFFKRETNGNLRCDSCTDKLCKFKKFQTSHSR